MSETAHPAPLSLGELKRLGRVRPSPTYAEGRTCKRCGYPLSRYNPGSECFRHKHAPRERDPQILSER